MLTFLRLLTAAVLLGIAAILAVIFVPHRLTPPQTQLAADWTAPEGAGEYVMRLADCAACHTAVGGQAFAGGRAIESPLGTIWSSNITPDPETGIGGYTLDQFRAALVDGVAADGHQLYPAMPYENYRMMSEEDIRAVYGYFMTEVAPVAKEVPETELSFPFNQRWGIRMWNWVALGKPGVPARDTDPATDPVIDPVMARGAYLAEGPAHCGACHSPRNLVMAQAGLTADDRDFVTGGEIGGWSTPPLRGAASAMRGWTRDDMTLFFASGRNNHVGVVGEMSLVVKESTQYWSQDDLDALSTYLLAMNTPPTGTPPPEAQLIPPYEPPYAPTGDATTLMLAAASPNMPLGARLYLDNCNACHFVNGRGAAQVFPQLAGNSLVNAPLPTGIVDVILNGAQLPSTQARPMALRMPGFANRLSDTEVAELASFVRSAWGNAAPAVTAAAVAAHRGETAPAP